MVRILRKVAVFTVGLLLFNGSSFVALASETGKDEQPANETNVTKTVSGADDSLFPKKTLSLSTSHFTWGAEVGSSLDMSSHDLSTFDVDVLLGYKNSVIKVAGVGSGIHRSIHSGNNFIPLYAVFRTGFTRKPSPFFLNLQGGYCFSRVGRAGTGGHAGNEGHSKTVGDFYGALGVGMMFKMSGLARPYVIVSAACQHFSEKNQAEVELDSKYIIFTKIVIGVNF